MTPGVYLFKDSSDKVIYVGKADNLRSRVRSYFNRSGSGDGRQLVPLLVSAARDVDIVVVANTKEALLLENQLIKQHQPRFNVKLKDDSNYLSIRLDTRHEWPRVDLVRKIRRDGTRYFGPYDSATSVRRTLQVLNRHFQPRTCSDSVLKNRSRPCILFQIKRCPAPCVDSLAPPPREYAANVDAAALFLEGRGEELCAGLEERMRIASESLEFEHAARLRDQSRAVRRVLIKQQVVFTHGKDEDVFGFARQDDIAQVHLLKVRRGHLRDIRRFNLAGLKLGDAEVVGSFVNQYYAARVSTPGDLPHRVLVPFDLEDAEAKEAWLSECAGRRVEVRRPQRGRSRKVMDTACRNAEVALEEADRDENRRQDILDRLAVKLRLPTRPETIDCADISLFQGSEAVGSVVRFRDALPFKDGYRRFKVRTVAGTDDFAMMYEVLTRHLKRCAEAGDLPDLLVVDGGKGQLGVARAAARDLGLDDLALASLAKSRVTDAPAHAASAAGAPPREGDRSQRSDERVFLPGAKDPLILRQSSAELLLLARLRDEAHRFAITYHRRRRKAATLKSALDEIAGVGPSRRKALLTAFGSVDGVRVAPTEALATVAGIGPALAGKIKAALA